MLSAVLLLPRPRTHALSHSRASRSKRSRCMRRHTAHGDPRFPVRGCPEPSNALAILFSLLMRPVITSHVPLAIVDAPMQGTGKTPLVTTLGTIAVGNVSSESIPSKENDDEWRKKISSILLAASPSVLLDNIPDNTTIDSPWLAAALTSRRHGRIPRSSPPRRRGSPADSPRVGSTVRPSRCWWRPRSVSISGIGCCRTCLPCSDSTRGIECAPCQYGTLLVGDSGPVTQPCINCRREPPGPVSSTMFTLNE